MVGKWATAAVLASVLCGLCAPARAITTGPSETTGVLAVDTVQEPSPAAPSPVPVSATPRVALLLPLRSESLGEAAEAVRAGFMAGFERDKDSMALTVFETGDAAQNTLAGYADAAANNDIVVGPLSRTDVTAITLSRAIGKPTIALTQPDVDVDAEGALPRQLLVIALSIEDEARQVAQWAGAGRNAARVFTVSGNTAWQRRAAKAFAAQWKQQGGEAAPLELSASAGYFSASSLAMLKKRVQSERPALLFLALDAGQAKQVRAVLGNEVALYGTSQLNPTAPQDRAVAEPSPELNGVRLLDLPWQIQLDDPAVMIYPRAEVATDQRRSADLERLYALGIDAYRIAHELALQHTRFDIDGVSGRLSVGFGKGPAKFKRTLLPAVYQDGVVVALPNAPQ
ncbi:MAG: penicillin-binding protein activator [Pseudomonadota bacterium]|nr:penicillin-binding protein activator [Pseudomonadota bacterium]